MKFSGLALMLVATLYGSHTLAAKKTVSADNAITSVKSYGFVDLEGAKTSAIIVEYNTPIDAKSVDSNDYQITDYALYQERQHGFDKTIERDNDSVKGNEGHITKVYVNNKPMPSISGGTKSGRYVILEVNTAYMLKAQNLVYTSTMMAGVKQISDIQGEDAKITAGTKEIVNYTITQQKNKWSGGLQNVITADKSTIILPQFDSQSGWTLHRIGDGAFKATHTYSEYTGKYEDFELPYSIYVPDPEQLKQHKGNISLVLHMEHAGANNTDPMAALTSSKAAVKLSGDKVQTSNPAIIVVPQIEESRRSTNDLVSSSEANTAVWELVDSILKKYHGYINTDRIYGTGQSMGGMLLLNMAAQRDNFFAGIAVAGSQWSNNYNKNFQNNGSPARTPENDPISFNGFGLDKHNYQNWYYMVSDDNILVHSCSGDSMASGEWNALSDYYKAAGVTVTHAQWDPYLPLETQNTKEKEVTNHDNTTPGSGINWISFTRGNHMSTWKYAYQLDYPFQWLFSQRRQSEQERKKITQLSRPWLGRDVQGNIQKGSGTAQLNSTQFTPHGASSVFVEGWTPVSAFNAMLNQLPAANQITRKSSKEIEEASQAYNQLTQEERKQIKGIERLTEAQKQISALNKN
ncbi:peptidase [Vibrio sp. CAIM 722]|uniref:Peptidase n=1 Tax=Vibrio eleionomae TaxID=2653505 RepID=A0A7X4RW59_9VIBR|nr:hypothetical protein [Vibrio eleionomae]MZI95035.1 peptidase [Vibrio eleionomae]